MTPSPDGPGDRRELTSGWEAARSDPGAASGPGDPALEWIPARVPGTAASALQDRGRWRPGEPHDFDAEDWWFRTRFDAPAEGGRRAVLCLDGIATVADVLLNGEPLLHVDSMFESSEVDVTGRLLARNELVIHCRALAPLAAQPRRPRARWRTKLVADGGLRFFRAMLLGRLPGIAPGPAAVGPWRPVRLELRTGTRPEGIRLRTRLQGRDGVLSISARLDSASSEEGPFTAVLSGPSGEHAAELHRSGDGDGVILEGELRVPGVELWWPHTHGAPSLHELRLTTPAGERVPAGRVGFRSLEFGDGPARDVERLGIDLRVNGVRVFARGAVWTGADPVSLAPRDGDLRRQLELARDAGMNMIRLPGTGAYESAEFHDLCDELGIMVWQDLMFANLDYPFTDPEFADRVGREVRELAARISGRPSTTVICGNSEVEQQASMFGVEAPVARGEWFGRLAPEMLAGAGSDALYVPSAPCGGDVPFRPGAGIGTYYGVGCYRLPLSDTRRAAVRFAVECLAFSHIPGAASVEREFGGPAPLADPRWQAGIPREHGADWDFEEIRDHYLGELFGVDGAALRGSDPARYLELSRALTGEVLADVFGEWRRERSGCGGALMLWLRDLLPGPGWGLIDHLGEPKPAYHRVARALAPLAVWTVDEQLGGIVVHVANDRAEPISGTLRLSLFSSGHLVEEALRPLELAPHRQDSWTVEELVGRFVDSSWAYRFGPPAADAIFATLQDRDGGILSQAVRFPAGWPVRAEPAAEAGLRARLRELPGDRLEVLAEAERLAWWVSVRVPGYRPCDEGFSIEPGGRRSVLLERDGSEPSLADGTIGAMNATGRTRITAP